MTPRTTTKVLLICLIAIGSACMAQSSVKNYKPRARVNGPSVDNLARHPGKAPHAMLNAMFESIEQYWLPVEYEAAKSVDVRATLDASLPAGRLDKRLASQDAIDFDVNAEGLHTPNGRYRFNLKGEMGDMEIIDDLKRSFMTSHDFRAFSDKPNRARKEGAGLTNYRSYFLGELGDMRRHMLESGVYRAVYTGTGRFENNDVEVINFYKPQGPADRKKSTRKAPIPLKRLWTFYQEGGYEIWLYRATHLPAVIFYTNTRDNIYMNMTFRYDNQWMPTRITFYNNSVKSEGRGDLVLSYDENRMIQGASLTFDGDNGIALRLDANLAFGGEPAATAFRILPAFGYKKLNSDHLKLMLLTQASGNLLKLKKHGFNLRNFKF
ncbi:hypothetical protein [Acanthopleuribacter pedis]|uniref:Uncharacterized protein n=1 Tax=Acanthopleuribacter pedis TaxID=442870 RepID=A0A8J7QBV2_9BACT|nr:hypothetical protein [Acanthopleuribacter pedis]MBO1321249.1 hypothetical protein [Acanthopleuribacter pedis]